MKSVALNHRARTNRTFEHKCSYAFMLLPVHILAGGVAMVLGAVALVASKGATLHRKSGLLFVYAMLTMDLAVHRPPLESTNMNVLGGFMAAYFVVTALTTVNSASRWDAMAQSGSTAGGYRAHCCLYSFGFQGACQSEGYARRCHVFHDVCYGTITAAGRRW